MNRFILKGLSLSILSMILCGPVLAVTLVSHDVGVVEVLVSVEKPDGSEGSLIPLKIPPSERSIFFKKPESSKDRSLGGYKVTGITIINDMKTQGQATEKTCSTKAVENLVLTDRTFLELSVKRGVRSQIAECTLSEIKR